MDHEVASFFGTLGLKINEGEWKRADARIMGLRGAIANGLAKASARVEGILGSLGAKLGAAFGAVKVVQLSDSYTSLENRLRQVSKGQEHLSTLMDESFAIAQRTRSSWTATGEAFVRLSNATKEMNISEERRLKLVETLNMALQSSGATASEAASGTLQLMQGLAAGALQGDEFRSIAEQLPDLMDLFAKEMKVSRGELKKLGAEGKITSKVVVAALENASDSIRDKFGASTKTAGQLWTVFTNRMTLAAGNFARDANLIGAIETVLNGLADVLPYIAQALTAVAKGIGEVFDFLSSGSDEAMAVLIGIATTIAAIVVPALYSMAAGWIAALAPILAVVAAVAAVALGVIKLVKHWDKIRAIAGRAWDWIKGKAVGFVDYMRSLPGRILDSFRAMVDSIRQFFADVFDWIIAEAKKLPGRIPILGRLGRALGEGTGAIVNAITGDTHLDAIDTITEAPATVAAPTFTPPPPSSGGRSVVVGPTTVNVHAAPGMDEERIGEIAGAAAREQLDNALRAED